MRRLLILVSLAALPALSACGGGEDRPELIVGAASSLLPLLEELGPVFEDETQIDLNITYGASGIIARQIEQGAPIDVFLSADRMLADQLAEDGLLREDSIITIGLGVLVAVRPQDGETATFLDARRIAIANPETAPYGAAAKRILEASGIWGQVEHRVVYAESALQALQFVRTAEADIGMVPLSLIAQGSHGVERIEGVIYAFFEESVFQTAAIVAASRQVDDAARFIDYLTSPAAQSLLVKYGYEPAPQEVVGVHTG